jgi:hypothetical protein
MYRHSDEIIVSTRAVAKTPSVTALIPIMAVVLIAFLIIGLALPVLPLQVHLLGGAKVALVCVLVEAAGLALIWLATDRTTAGAGAALAGFGYALVYPGLGIEAVRRAPSQSRGLARGAYTVFLDVALGFGSPVLGLTAGRFGLDTVFLASALIALGAATISIRILFTGCCKRREQCLTSS